MYKAWFQFHSNQTKIKSLSSGLPRPRWSSKNPSLYLADQIRFCSSTWKFGIIHDRCQQNEASQRCEMIINSRENKNCFNVQLGSAANSIWKSLLMQTLTTCNQQQVCSNHTRENGRGWVYAAGVRRLKSLLP